MTPRDAAHCAEIDQESLNRLKANVEAVRGRIAGASARARRSPSDVRLVAVTKSVEPPLVRALSSLDIVDVAENRVQQLVSRAAELGDSPRRLVDAPIAGGRRWHMIGHLQRNKVKPLLRRCRVVHSVDSQRLLSEISAQATAIGATIDLLLEFNLAGDGSKTGAPLAEAEMLASAASTAPGVVLRGLMTMAPLDGGPDGARRAFTALRELLHSMRSRGVVPGACDQLSMGMSGDFEIAVEEGATMVRVGSALFEGLAEP